MFDPDETLFAFCGRGTSAAGSGDVGGGRWGIVGADNLRWTAAAEGTEGIVEFEVLWARTGLRSWLFFLDRVGRGPAVVAGFSGGRWGEPSREDFGEARAEEGDDICGVVGVRVRSEGEDEDFEGSLVLLVDASGPCLCAFCGLSSPSALVSSLLGASAGKAMGNVVIGGRGVRAEGNNKRQYSYLRFLTHGPAIRGLWGRGRSHGSESAWGEIK